MLEKIRIRNVKALQEIDLIFGRFQIVVAPNGCGKTTLLQAIEWGMNCNTQQHSDYIFSQGFGSLKKWITNGQERLEIGVAIVSQEPQQTDSINVHLDSSGYQIKLNGIVIANVFYNTARQKKVEEKQIRAEKAAFTLQLQVASITKPVALGEPILQMDGTGLANVLADIALSDISAFQEIVTSLRAVVPTVKNIRLVRTQIENNIWGYRFELEYDDHGIIAADQVSEGTLITLGILVALRNIPRPATLLIDDIERGLHPKAQKELMLCLRRLLAQDQQLQIICTTHSPYMVDYFEAHEVLVMGKNKQGYAVCKKLDEHPKWQNMKALVQAGEFWSSVGEDWVNT